MTISLTVRPHTVYLLCGPTMCGKSTFAEKLVKLAYDLGLSCKLISSDAYRTDLVAQSSLLGNDPVVTGDSRHTDAMMATSHQAFELLYSEFRQAVSYPINSEIVIVDTTGFNEVFRKDIVRIGRDHSYRVELVTFEYKSRADYIPEEVDDETKIIINSNRDRYNKRILPHLYSRDYDGRIRIKTRAGWDEDFEVLVEQNEGIWEYNSLYRNEELFAVIGDSHECVTELKEMISQLESKYPGIQLIHVGDYLDKGGNTAEMVDFMYDRVVLGKDWLITANHENYAYKRFTNQISNIDLEMEAQNFSSVAVLEKNSQLVKLFMEIHAMSVPFLALFSANCSDSKPIIITHAPCSNKHLAKYNSFAIGEQRNYRSKDRTQPWSKELDWFYKEADTLHPLHVFGHVAHKVTRPGGHKYKNKLFLDTGCVYGNKLSAAVFENSVLKEIVEVQSSKPVRDEKLALDLGYPPVEIKPFSMEDYDLEWRDVRLLDQIEEHGIKYISGTMSPAPSTDDEIEPLQACFNYYKSKGVTRLIMQPKYMGSRCQTYLFKDAPEKTFQVSRGGWRIKKLENRTDEEYQQFLKDVYNQYKYLFTHSDSTWGILDGELLPWTALGAGLIDKAFTPYYELIRDELLILGQDAGLAALPDLSEKLDIAGKIIDLAAFNAILAEFTQDTAPSFKAFDVLDIDGAYKELIDDNVYTFTLVNSDEHVAVNLETEEGVEEAFAFYKNLTVNKKMEGVVVKPIDKKLPQGAPPYMKVRSPEYLRLVYGYNYPSRLGPLCRQKNISGKVQLSIREYESAMKMLTAESDERKELIVKMIGNMKQEKFLDPRL